ncbi:ABC transporter permease [Stackebrandtia nassauensis]|uniref:Binding-protein-dependent transport systems inner membrane component n=1 Tax=Stackebrandtia nassauensis (strain DSM 44728 / CIP 108903 / NRRL B-16338 / NBRC 102104 / LLR-40K-21) TaxID=446470 RepID=D3QBI5_STANL|nr:ABC transporter permease [Stackebrandtia nassauensis]ADD42867.1 binding-protein-dependent transport systems inner membrane component [Stackebrandtia nassauensis DSM 44728]
MSHRAAATFRFVGVRLGGAAVSLLLVLVSAFFIFRVLGGDPVTAMTRDSPATPEQKAALRRELGLDKGLGAQFVDYVREMLSGRLGVSYQSRSPVVEVIWERLPATVLLTGTALVLASGVGLWIGSRAGWRAGSRFDRVHVGVSLTLWSAPTFWLGLVSVMVFGRLLGWFPVNGMRSARGSDGWLAEVVDVAHHLVLPAVTMAAVIYAQYVLVMRSSIMEEKSADYVLTARAKGLRDEVVRRRHAVPNALLPTVTLVFLQLGGVVGGAVLTETVFSWPGLGLLTYQALKIPDIPLLQGTFVFFSAAVIVANTLADIVYRMLDPRVRVS